MAQITFLANNHNLFPQAFLASNGTLSFVPFNIWDSISFSVVNVALSNIVAVTISLSVGLYSLTGSTLSIANSISGTIGFNSFRVLMSLTATSATQNITPGTWFFGLLASTSGNNSMSFLGVTGVNPDNAFPGAFIGGRMTDSTSALPSSLATSVLDITGNDAMSVPFILLTT